MSRYAPAREDGFKPWVVTVREWGKSWERIEWAETRAQAEYQAKERMRYRSAQARRATPEDMPAPAEQELSGGAGS